MSDDGCSSKAKEGDQHRHGVSCQGAHDLLFDLLEGHLPAEKEASVRTHFQRCPPCLDFLESYRKTPKICREALARDVPPEVTQSLLAFLRKEIGSK